MTFHMNRPSDTKPPTMVTKPPSMVYISGLMVISSAGRTERTTASRFPANSVDAFALQARALPAASIERPPAAFRSPR